MVSVTDAPLPPPPHDQGILVAIKLAAVVVALPVPCPRALPEDGPDPGSHGLALGETPAPGGLVQGGSCPLEDYLILSP